MPVYCFACPKCGQTAELIRDMERRNDPVECQVCQHAMERDIRSERCASTDQEYQRPVISMAAGCHPSQVPEFRKAHPNIPITNSGEVIFTSHNQRKRALREMGMHDRDGYN